MLSNSKHCFVLQAVDSILEYNQLNVSLPSFAGVVLDILVAVGIIKPHHFWLDVEHLEEAFQNILVCLEMVFFAVLQQYAYHVNPYSGDDEAKLKLGKKME
ncbi:hypothetical protein F3Y22_tig00110556pilonHSYRG00146 [Hibiscus syriacus]|uniref:Uncharacterized protein n=1 Tax=Hibiscus syriacus TaxID=106335 RepID=A0A6A3A8N9_HIBSY|nr:hypothetical protein F3Y22_tig00110556pilonHSYRG00146 [Hibiscus syriacus]